MADTELAEELLLIEEADAWFEYLESTRGQTQTATPRSSRGPGPASRSGCARSAPGVRGSGPPQREADAERRPERCWYAVLRLMSTAVFESTQREPGNASWRLRRPRATTRGDSHFATTLVSLREEAGRAGSAAAAAAEVVAPPEPRPSRQPRRDPRPKRRRGPRRRSAAAEAAGTRKEEAGDAATADAEAAGRRAGATPAAAKSPTRSGPEREARAETPTGGSRAAARRRARRRGARRCPRRSASCSISVDVGEQRVAILEDDRVAEVYLERPERRSIAGNIYLGVVDNVLPGMEAAFVEIGLEKNGFLYVDEIVGPELEGARARARSRI